MKAPNKHIFILFALSLLFLLNSAGFCQVFKFEKNPREHIATFPAGTFFKGVLQNEISSEKNGVGDKVYMIIPFDVKIGEVTCIPAQTLIIGEIIQIQKAQEGKNGFVQIKFDQMVFPDGTGTQMSGHIWSGNKGILGGETTKRIAYKKVPHYIEDIGIVAKLVETGDRAMGKNKILPVGTECVVVLDNALKVNYLERL